MQFDIEEYRERLAEKVRNKRRAVDLTQKELAKKAGVSEVTVVSIEKMHYRSLTVSTIQAVCKALDIHATMGLEDDKRGARL